MADASGKTSVLVIGSQGHKKAEKSVAWGEFAYVPEFDVVICDTTSLTKDQLTNIFNTNRDYLPKLRSMFIEAQERRNLKIVVILSPLQIIDSSDDKGMKISNYYWSPIIPILEELPGNKIDTSKTHKGLKYFSKIKNWDRLYDSYINNTPYKYDSGNSDKRFQEHRIDYVVNGINRAIAFGFHWRVHNGYGNVVIDSGDLVFLPSLGDSKESIDVLIEEFIEDEEPQPNWISEIVLPAEQEIVTEITGIEGQIEVLETEKGTKLTTLNHLNEYKKILYLKGKTLERSVEHCFRFLGIELLSPTVGNEEDRYYAEGETRIPIEIRGKNNEGLTGKDLNQLIARIPDKASGNYNTQGVFILNHFKDTRPGERPKPFEDNLIKKAVACDACLIAASDIFDLIRAKMNGVEMNELKEALFNTRGVFSAQEYLSKKIPQEKPETLSPTE